MTLFCTDPNDRDEYNYSATTIDLNDGKEIDLTNVQRNEYGDFRAIKYENLMYWAFKIKAGRDRLLAVFPQLVVDWRDYDKTV